MGTAKLCLSTTTISACPNPYLDVVDFTGRHFLQPDGYGGRVHVPNGVHVDYAPLDLRTGDLGRRFPVVLASDVLYARDLPAVVARGIARHLAPAGVTVASAGSEPAHVRAEAIEALAERGVDISSHESTSVDDVPPEGVEVVITLCAEEVCPVFLGSAERIHWGMPDPAAVEGEGRLDAFREVRDELWRRFEGLFATSS